MGVSRCKTILLIDPTMTGRNFRDRMKKAGYEVIFFADLEEGYQFLLHGYAHLAIIDDRFVREYPIEEDDYFPKIFKMLKLSRPHYKGENERAGELARGGFIDEILGGNLGELDSKVNRFFNMYYKKFSWDLVIQDEAGQPEQMIGLAAKLVPATSVELLPGRANELSDLIRFLFHEDHAVTLYPPLWVRDGLAAVEVMAVHPSGRHPERSLLVLGEVEEIHKAHKAYLECRPDSFVPGVTREIDLHVINRFGAIKYNLIGWRGQGTRLITASEWLRRRGDPHTVAKTVLRLIHQDSQLYFTSQAEQVEPLKNIRLQLDLPEKEHLLEQLTGRLDAWFAQPCWSGTAAAHTGLDGQNRRFWEITVDEGPPLSLKQHDFSRLLHAIENHRELQHCTTAPGNLRLINLIMEDCGDDQELGWVSDFRKSGETTCDLYNLTLYAAELRYCLARPAGFRERLELERTLLGCPGEINHPAARAAFGAIHQFLPPPSDPSKQLLHTRAMMLHAIARFLQAAPVGPDHQMSQDAMLLIASMALMGETLTCPPEPQAVLLKQGTGETEFILMEKSFTLTEASARVLRALLVREDHTLTYIAYEKEVLGYGENDRLIKHSELLQTYISHIRKALNALDTRLGPMPGSRMIVFVANENDPRKNGYRLVLDFDRLMEAA